MAASNNKLSFGFSKVKAPSKLVKPVPVEKTEIEYVDSFDGSVGKFSYQGTVRSPDEVKKKLVIPLIGAKSAYDVIKDKLKLPDSEVRPIAIKEENSNENDRNPTETTQPEAILPPVNDDEKSSTDVKPSLEDLAAHEILSNLGSGGSSAADSKGLKIIASEKVKLEGEKESSQQDYEDVPVDQFGLAMLRGMGWTEKTGIGKENKVVAPVTSQARPRRLGLGADMSSVGPALPLKKGSYIRVEAGQLKGFYGVVESVDADCGTVFAKLDEKGMMSLSENILAVVTKAVFDERTKCNGQANKKEGKYGLLSASMESPSETTQREPSSSLLQVAKQNHRIKSKKEEKPPRPSSKSPVRQKHTDKRSRIEDESSVDHKSSSSRHRSATSKKDRSRSKSPVYSQSHKENKHSRSSKSPDSPVEETRKDKRSREESSIDYKSSTNRHRSATSKKDRSPSKSPVRTQSRRENKHSRSSSESPDSPIRQKHKEKRNRREHESSVDHKSSRRSKKDRSPSESSVRSRSRDKQQRKHKKSKGESKNHNMRDPSMDEDRSLSESSVRSRSQEKHRSKAKKSKGESKKRHKRDPSSDKESKHKTERKRKKQKKKRDPSTESSDSEEKSRRKRSKKTERRDRSSDSSDSGDSDSDRLRKKEKQRKRHRSSSSESKSDSSDSDRKVRKKEHRSKEKQRRSKEKYSKKDEREHVSRKGNDERSGHQKEYSKRHRSRSKSNSRSFKEYRWKS